MLDLRIDPFGYETDEDTCIICHVLFSDEFSLVFRYTCTHTRERLGEEERRGQRGRERIFGRCMVA